MILITLVGALLLVQIWGSGKPFHKDTWFFQWISRVNQWEIFEANSYVKILFVVLLPVIFVLLVIGALEHILSVLGLLAAIAVLTYSFGRGEFNSLSKSYIAAYRQSDWDGAISQAKFLEVNVHQIEPDDWSDLNHQMVVALAYRGFERMFAVIFWLLLGGVAGALAYRLLALYKAETDSNDDFEKLDKMLWLFEWVPVRIFGLSMALTGNFASCFYRWKQHFWCSEQNSIRLLIYYVESALNVTKNDIENPKCGEKELTELTQLYSRTLILWVCAIAVWSLVF